MEFKVNWASGTTIVTLLVGIITLYMTNQGLKGKVDSLEKNNISLTATVQTLSATVNTLKGSQSIMDNALVQFMQNSPGELKYRIERLENIMEQRFGAAPDATAVHNAAAINRPPGR